MNSIEPYVAAWRKLNMSRAWPLFALLSLLVFSGSSRASEEEYLPFQEIRIDLGERPQTGRVTFAAKTADAKFQEVTIEAFGKMYTADKETLGKLTGSSLVDIQATHEAGYPRLGGHSIYFKLRPLVPTGPSDRRIVVVVQKEKGISVLVPK